MTDSHNPLGEPTKSTTEDPKARDASTTTTSSNTPSDAAPSTAPAAVVTSPQPGATTTPAAPVQAAAPIVGAVQLTEEEKKAEAQKLERQNQIEATTTKLAFANAWNALHHWQKLEVISLDDPDAEQEIEPTDECGLKSLVTASGLLKPGLYGIPGSERQIRIKQDGSVFPVPSRFSNDKDFHEAYSSAMKGITGQGFDTVTITWTGTEGKPSVKRLLDVMRIAEENNLSVEFGDDVKTWLDNSKSITGAQRKEIYDLKNLLDLNVAKSELLGELGKSSTLDKYSGLLNEEGKLNQLPTTTDSKKYILDHAYGDIPRVSTNAQDDANKLLAIEKQLNEIDARANKAEMAKNELTTYLNTYEKLINDPEQMKTKEFEFKDKKLNKADKFKPKKELNDPLEVIERIETLDEATKDKQKGLLKALEAERKDLEDRQVIWKEELTALKDKFVNDKKDPTKNVSTLEARVEKLEKKIGEIDKKLESIGTAKTEMGTKMDAMPQKITEQKDKFSPVSKAQP